MKLAASNIAWLHDDDAAVAPMLLAAGVSGLEVAPSMVWSDPLRASADDLRAYRRWWLDQGLEVVAMQALLFGRPDLALFGEASSRAAMLDHLTRMMDIGHVLGAGPLVFGSPRNRSVGTRAIDATDARRTAVEFFRAAGSNAAERGVVLCIEPNPRAYDCDFINTVDEARALVQEVGSAGFGLHVDAGALALNSEPVTNTIAGAGASIRHFHASEPNLAPLGSGPTDHDACAAALRSIGYGGWVSLEMRTPPGGLPALQDSVARLVAHYGS